MVGVGKEQSLHFGSVTYFQRHRFSGVGKQSAPTLSIKDSCPEGRPEIILFQTLHFDSRATTSLNLKGIKGSSSEWSVNLHLTGSREDLCSAGGVLSY